MLRPVVEADPASQHSYSMRLVLPFYKLLQQYPSFPTELLPDPASGDADERLPVATVHELLRGAIVITGDEDLALKAARLIEPGDYGALEYAASSAATVGQSFAVIGRYMALVNDALSFMVELEEDTFTLRMESAVPLPRAAEDFQMGALVRAASFRRPPGPEPEYELHFMHPEPEDTREYALSFPNARVLFNKPFSAFIAARAYFDVPLPTADPKLHSVIRKHADQLLAELPRPESFTGRVRELLMAELRGGNPSAPNVAAQLHMSARTLTRKLDAEGTTFKALLEDLRRNLSLRYVGRSDLPLSEITFLLGFSQVAAFHRAFKRWTGKTPMEYRREHRM